MKGKLEIAEGRSWTTGSAYRSLCHLKGEKLAVSRVVYRDENGELFVRHHKGVFVKVRKEGMRHYEV